jgi:hypothetical protein
MGLKLDNLDNENIRKYMLEEVDRDVKENILFISNRLKEGQGDKYIALLKEAVIRGTDDSFASAIRDNACLKTKTVRNLKTGPIMVDVPKDAHITLAEGEFNRFYIRALCREAIDVGKGLEIYRAKSVNNPRPESQSKIGSSIDPNMLLNDLRRENKLGESMGNRIDTALGVPAGPNSGLSVRLLK